MSYFYNKRMNKLENLLQEFKDKNNATCQAEKLVHTKKGEPVYLIHRVSSEDGQIYGGFIYVLTTKGFNGCLDYLVLNRNDQRFHIVDITHKLLDQGIGSHLLEYLEEIALDSGIKIISVCLPPIQLKNNQERLMHFSSRNGYTVDQGRDPVWETKSLIAVKHL